RGAADDLARAIAGRRGSTFGLHRLSFTQLAARAAATGLALGGRLPATALGGEAIAARITFEALTDGALNYFEPVAPFPGFPRALARTIDELRQAGVQPRALEAVGRAGGDLSILLTRFAETCETAA